MVIVMLATLVGWGFFLGISALFGSLVTVSVEREIEEQQRS